MNETIHTSRGAQGSAGVSRRVDTALPALDGVEHRFINLPGLRMHVAQSGHGEPVLLLHGFPQHWWEWRDIIPGLSSRYRVICPDLRGAGWTEAPPGGYTLDGYLGDIVALLDALHLERVKLIAHDYGAVLGFVLCQRHPDRVSQFVCLGPHPFVDLTPKMLTVMWRLWFQFVLATPGIGSRTLGSGRQRLPRYLFRNDLPERQAWSEGDLAVFLDRLRDPARARAGSALYRHFILPAAGQAATGAFKKAGLDTPTLVLAGADDRGLPPELLGGFEKYTDNMSLEAVDRAAHFIADQRPDVVVDRALAFFSGR